MRLPIRTVSRDRVAMAFLAAALAAMPLAASADEADAKQILKTMSDWLAGEDAITFDYDSTLEVVTDDDQKLGIASSGSVALDRPDRIRATRANGFIDVEVIFDGETLTILGRNANRYAQVETPGSIDHVLQELHMTYGVPLPAADLLSPDPYEALMASVDDIKDLGSGMVDGVECDWLAFRTAEVDWQIWISRGDEPWPCRFSITTKGLAQGPGYMISMHNWRTGSEAAGEFAFMNTTDADEISIEELREQFGDLPDNFTMETTEETAK